MSFYELEYIHFFDKNDGKKRRQIGDANGEKVPNGKYYFDRMGTGEIIKEAPVFDYFYLMSFDKPQFWEWRLQDIHGFIGEYPTGGTRYISDRFKKLIEQYSIAKGFWFYPTNLMYKEVKHDYWIFQYATIDEGIDNKVYLNYQKSEFFDADKNSLVSAVNFEEYNTIRKKIQRDSDYEKDIIPKKIVLNQNVDFIPMYGIIDSGIIISERLKEAIEKLGLEGFKFLELDYEVVIE
ncbi:hypothetical protein HNQ02_000012 [Flavobacterium sp. 7E]|uniref:hypothetical protein n=1 Tax=Flavobacterium sp. 7E TaxID=2735898 RepID=UPI00156DE3CB|nr:hypothetical protein [Flavobacterium sp. 7E]NRS87112.1 hypothetical protein [Flavobacterium sp. 7E]